MESTALKSCPDCNASIPAGVAGCPHCGAHFAVADSAKLVPPPAEPPPPKPVAMLQYKVVEKKHRSLLRGRLTAQQLEDLINEHAREGWVLDRIVAGETA